MTLMITPGTIGSAVAGTLLLALGGFALSLSPRTRTTIAFGTFCIALGTSFGPLNVVGLSHPLFPVVLATYTVSDLATAVSIAVLALSIPRPLPRTGLRKAVFPAVLAGGFLATAVLVAVSNAPWYSDSYASEGLPAMFHAWRFVDEEIILMALYAALLGGAALAAIRYRESNLSYVEHGQCAIIGASFVAMVGASMDIASAADGLQPTDGVTLAGALLLVFVSGLWLATAARAREGAKGARNVALVALVSLLLVSIDHLMGVDGVVYGVIRVFAALLLGYGVLRHRLLGIDVRVRWTISRGTVAAAFIAAFFVASEGAQIAFGQGNEWVGLLAAGALVFAIAPLQRAAERLAERAVPSAPVASATPAVGATGRGPDAGRRETYRRAVRHALQGRVMTREEERYLADLATCLGIDYRRALDIREDVEREMEART